jgi:hypothetical protein
VRKTALRELHTHHKKKKVYPVYEGKKVFLTLRGGSSSLIFTTIGYKKTHTAYCIGILLMEVMSPQPPPGGTKNIYKSFSAGSRHVKRSCINKYLVVVLLANVVVQEFSCK